MIDFIGDIMIYSFALYGAYAYTRDLMEWVLWKMQLKD